MTIWSIKRRDFLTRFGGAAATLVLPPRATRAQQPAMPIVGYLGSASPVQWAGRLRAFRQGLGESGFIEGRNVAIDYRWAEGQNDRLPALAADLVRRQVAVIAAPASAAAGLAAMAATTAIPIVFYVSIDPVASGLVASLNRPGGNLTGVTNLSLEIAPKRLELLREAAPTATVIAQLINPTNPAAATLSRDMQTAARGLGLQLAILKASAESDFDAVFATVSQLRAGGLVIGPDPFFNSLSERLGELALRRAVPTISEFREFAAAGGLMSYGGSNTDAHRLVGVYTGRILKGEKPADLPVQQATKVELIINLKTAKALGLSVPLSLLGRADEVIE